MTLSKIMAAIAALLFLASLAIPAQAKVQKQFKGSIITCDQWKCSDWVNHRVVKSAKTARRHTIRQAKITHQRASNEDVLVDKPQERANRRAAYDSTIIGGRPAGCPYRFCGCGLSLKMFGKIRPELNLAWNWVKYFPLTSPAPGMAAARRGHVMGLLSHVGGSDWLVYDANSGGGLIRQHVRSIRGYVIVNPYASRMASK